MVRRAWINWETEIHTHGAPCIDLQHGKPTIGLILRTPSKWEPRQDTKPDEMEHRAQWEGRRPGHTRKWEELHNFAIE